MALQTDARKSRTARTLPTGHGELSIGGRCLLMGILNVTPDSFSDGGRFYEQGAAVARAIQLQQDGADIIDIGGESTRPGSTAVPPDEQIRRVVPVIRAARSAGLTIPVSIDTRSAAVAEAALDAGADIVNDVSAARHDSAMPRLLAARRVPFIIMHMQGTPETMQVNPRYEDVLSEVRSFFDERAEALHGAGVDVDRLMIVDPGIGFGKQPSHNWTLLRRASELGGRWPVLVGASRKKFLRALVENEPAPGTAPPDRVQAASALVAANAAVVTLLALSGVDVLRVHDVREMRAALAVNRLMQGCDDR